MKNGVEYGVARHAGRHAPPTARAPDAFWGDFRARAAMDPQMEATPSRPVARLTAGWAVAVALAALGVGLAVWRGATPAVSPAILSLSAGAGDRPVFILRDDRTAALILWVDAADTATPIGGSEG